MRHFGPNFLGPNSEVS